MCLCLSAMELNVPGLTAACLWLHIHRALSPSLSLWPTHTLLADFLPFFSLPSPPLSLQTHRVTHCLQAFQSAVLSPCSWRYFSIQSGPLHVATYHQARPCISSLRCLLAWQLLSTGQSGCSCLQLFTTWKLVFLGCASGWVTASEHTGQRVRNSVLLNYLGFPRF